MNVLQKAPTVLATIDRWDSGAPAVRGPAIYGASPNKEFLLPLPVTGERPLWFAVEGLPVGLTLDVEKGRITGRVFDPGRHTVMVRAANRHGTAERPLTLVFGERALALTPPMGWNSWNCYRSEISADKIARIAEGMVSSGLAAHGYSYVNIDSGWQSTRRGGRFNSIVPHDGFPDMADLATRIHSLGLKLGIYSGPYVIPWGTEGCGTSSGIMDTRFPFHPIRAGKYIGMHKHEAEDVAQWADWGIDYFKYDWGHSDMELTERMSRALEKAPRDIVYSVTTHVNLGDAGDVSRLCNLWRSNDDTQPTWASVIKNGFGMPDPWNRYIGPGHWFDLDMTAILPRDGQRLSEPELIACLSCWALRPSPLMIDCNPAELDAFTHNLLCNDEVLAVNQDVLGKPAAVVARKDQWEIHLKPLADGSYAVGVFNLSDQEGMSPEVDLPFFGMHGDVKLRDLWAQQDLEGRYSKFSVAVAPHCAKLFRAIPA